jgi:hypothetical protein
MTADDLEKLLNYGSTVDSLRHLRDWSNVDIVFSYYRRTRTLNSPNPFYPRS